jgi:hypothetical protein
VAPNIQLNIFFSKRKKIDHSVGNNGTYAAKLSIQVKLYGSESVWMWGPFAVVYPKDQIGAILELLKLLASAFFSSCKPGLRYVCSHYVLQDLTFRCLQNGTNIILIIILDQFRLVTEIDWTTTVWAIGTVLSSNLYPGPLVRALEHQFSCQHLMAASSSFCLIPQPQQRRSHRQDDDQKIWIPHGSRITAQYHPHAVIFCHTWASWTTY